MDLLATDGLVTTLMNAKLMLTIVVFMHHAITLLALMNACAFLGFLAMVMCVKMLMSVATEVIFAALTPGV